MDFDAVKVTAGQTYTVGATSQTFTLPLASDGNFPKFVRILPEALCYVNFGISSALTAGIGGNTTGTPGIAVTPNEPSILNTRGNQYISAITRSGNTFVNVAPVET